MEFSFTTSSNARQESCDGFKWAGAMVTNGGSLIADFPEVFRTAIHNGAVELSHQFRLA